LNGVYWIYGNASAPLSPMPQAPAMLAPMPLAIVLCPSGGRYLSGELSHLKSAGIQTLVSLLSQEQVVMLDLAEEPLLARRLGMQFLHHPIPDHQLPPDKQAFSAFVTELARRLRAGQQIGIHCWGSIGRATITAACTLIHLGWSPAAALAAVEAARGLPVPDTEEQRHWILHYKADV
jgi:protein-tyrosine phosphatase